MSPLKYLFRILINPLNYLILSPLKYLFRSLKSSDFFDKGDKTGVLIYSSVSVIRLSVVSPTRLYV